MSLSADQLELVEATARRVVELLGQRDPGLVDPGTLARMLGVSRSTVYEHAGELGAIRLGEGPRARLRFDTQVAVEGWSRRVSGGESEAPSSPEPLPIRQPRRSRRSGGSDDLLPVRGPRGAV